MRAADGTALRRVRTCLRCGRRFHSSGPGNRICPECTAVNARLRVSERQLNLSRGRRYRCGKPLSDRPEDELIDLFFQGDA